jgi:hypothetical protein
MRDAAYARPTTRPPALYEQPRQRTTTLDSPHSITNPNNKRTFSLQNTPPYVFKSVGVGVYIFLENVSRGTKHRQCRILNITYTHGDCRWGLPGGAHSPHPCWWCNGLAPLPPFGISQPLLHVSHQLLAPFKRSLYNTVTLPIGKE